MDDTGWLGTLAKQIGAQVAALAAFLAWLVHLHRARNERRRDVATEAAEVRRHASSEKSDDWGRLRFEIERLDGRCDNLQKEVDDCREREGEWMKRAIAAEAALLGKGHAQQEAQLIVSKERTKDVPDGK